MLCLSGLLDARVADTERVGVVRSRVVVPTRAHGADVVLAGGLCSSGCGRVRTIFGVLDCLRFGLSGFGREITIDLLEQRLQISVLSDSFAQRFESLQTGGVQKWAVDVSASWALLSMLRRRGFGSTAYPYPELRTSGTEL